MKMVRPGRLCLVGEVDELDEEAKVEGVLVPQELGSQSLGKFRIRKEVHSRTSR